ncbi:MAG TPA: hypothetical protein PKO09_04035 [Anaerolineae bacterium]|nr:hypothetical protein [Anaerolineae bacterium]
MRRVGSTDLVGRVSIPGPGFGFQTMGRRVTALLKAWRWLRWVVVVAVLPFAILGLVALADGLVGNSRFDPSYFAAPYLERYSTPAAAVKSMESGLRRGDLALIAELQGLKRPASFRTSSGITFVELWENCGPYRVYLFLDRQTYMRSLIPFEEVQGRWVAGPRDLRFYLRSGHWRTPFLIAAGVWWALCCAGGGLLLLGRRTARLGA